MHGVLSSQKVPYSSRKVPVKIPSPGLGNPCVAHSNLRIWVLAYLDPEKIQKIYKGILCIFSVGTQECFVFVF